MAEVNRKLASIRKIGSVSPVEGADNIELVHVDGWQCISKKGDFKEGDFCVYFEIDSFLPIRPEFEFLRKSSYRKMGGKEGFRLKTIRLRGQLSQGLAMPIQLFKELPYEGYELFKEDDHGYGNGYDVTETLGVTKYEPPIPAQKASNVLR